MTTPIYKLWFVKRYSEAWYQLTREAQQALFAEHDKCAAELGVKPLLVCDSSWNWEQVASWGAEVYPDLSALQQFHARLNELGWLRYWETETILGTPMGETPQELPKQGIYKVFLARPAEAWHQLSKAEQDDAWNRQLATGPQVGATFYNFNARWTNEAWIAWGIGHYPDLSAEQRHAELLEEMNWYRYGAAQTTLGMRIA